MQMHTLDIVLDADPEFFTRHSVGHLVGMLFSQTAAAGAAVLAVIKQLSIVLLMVALRGDPGGALLPAHAERPGLRRARVVAVGAEHQAHRRVRAHAADLSQT